MMVLLLLEFVSVQGMTARGGKKNYQFSITNKGYEDKYYPYFKNVEELEETEKSVLLYFDNKIAEGRTQKKREAERLQSLKDENEDDSIIEL